MCPETILPCFKELGLHTLASVTNSKEIRILKGSETVTKERAEAVVSYKGPFYKSGYISVLEQKSLRTEMGEVDKLLEKYRLLNPDCPVMTGQLVGEKSNQVTSTKEGGYNREGYERASARHGDKVFLKFQKELSKCPQQILR